LRICSRKGSNIANGISGRMKNIRHPFSPLAALKAHSIG
jgi:hypothetical protein